MTRPIELLRQGRKEDLWQMCCGFIDLDLQQYMAVQERLLIEQLGLLRDSPLGRRIMLGASPRTVEDFRQEVPLTSYRDYLPELVEQQEDVLPARTAHWVRTSGKSGEYDVKWVPMSELFARECEKVCGAFALLCLCDGRGDMSKVKEHLKVLYTMGTIEYGTGIFGYLAQQAIGFDLLPAEGDRLAFKERIEAGFQEALDRGLDAFGGLPSVLVAVGEQIRQQSGNRVRPLLRHPRSLLRVGRALVRSRVAGRPMFPRDLWSIKGIVGGGTDSAVFGKRVEELWGRRPLELYGGTEGGVYAVQLWDYEGMTFTPNLDFFEFIPESEWFREQADRSYQPKTVLLNEVEAGQVYEIVITNFHGGIMTRYRPGDMVRIISLRNDTLGVHTPQMLFERRADELVDIFGVGHLSERLVWQAIENTGVPYVEWTGRKEAIDQKPTLHIYLELKPDYIASEEATAAAIHAELQKLDDIHNFNLYKFAYGDSVRLLELKPIKVSFLPPGTFSTYVNQRQAEGAELGHLKPPHINPSDRVMDALRIAAAEREVVPAGDKVRASVR